MTTPRVVWPDDGGDARKIIFIVAKDEPHAHAVANANGLRIFEWQYLSRLQQVERHEMPTIWLTGTWPLYGSHAERMTFREWIVDENYAGRIIVEYHGI